MGSVLPDVLEIGGLIKHRTITHFIWLWLFLCFVLWLCLDQQRATSIAFYIAFYIASGASLHICQDALSIEGVPIYTPYGSRVGLNMFRTATYGEEITVFGLVVLFMGVAWKRGFISTEYAAGQMGALVGLTKQLWLFI